MFYTRFQGYNSSCFISTCWPFNVFWVSSSECLALMLFDVSEGDVSSLIDFIIEEFSICVGVVHRPTVTAITGSSSAGDWSAVLTKELCTDD